MRKFKIIPLSFALSFLLVGTCAADWQFTKWGDSVDAVLKYKVEDMHETTDWEAESNSISTVGRALARSRYKTGEFETIATYLFRDRKLTGVDLTFLSTESARQALSRLKAQYGKPISSRDRMRGSCEDAYYEWSDELRGNFIAFNFYQCPNSGVISSVLYTPITSPKDSGL